MKKNKLNDNPFHYVDLDDRLYFTNLSTEAFMRMKYNRLRDQLKNADQVILITSLMANIGWAIIFFIAIFHIF